MEGLKDLNTCRFCGISGYNFANCSCKDAKAFRKKNSHSVDKNEEKKLEKLKKIDKFNSSIPKRYKNAQIKDFKGLNEQNKDIADYIKELAINFVEGLGMCLSGAVGAGKTHLAYAVAKYFCGLELSKQVPKSIKLHLELEKLLGNEAMSKREWLNNLANPDFLIIDDLGIKQLTEWEQLKFYDLIDRRNDNLKFTVITTNLSDDNFLKFVGARVFDRLKQHTKFFKLQGKSRR